MEQSDFKVYSYRWVILLAFMGIIALNQLLWITFAAITTDAMQFYKVSDLSIGVLSLIFMVVYVFVSSHFFPPFFLIPTPFALFFLKLLLVLCPLIGRPTECLSPR